MVSGAVGLDVRPPLWSSVLALCCGSICRLSNAHRSSSPATPAPGLRGLFMRDGAPAHHALATMGTQSRPMQILPGEAANL
jgi:hypothetical protein